MLHSSPKLEPIWKVPISLTPLIGREQEVTRLCTFLQRSEVRLLTLSGAGGIGKTRLSIQVATNLLEHFADGVCFVPLAVIGDPQLVVSAIAHELGIPELGKSDLFEQVKSVLQVRNLLLLLDNFEQVIAVAALLTELLAACPALKILVTSRAVLRISGEYEYVVPPLAVPNLQHLPDVETLSQYAAVKLFVQRVQATKPDFQLTEANAGAVAQICTRLDGLPLAIELAAARIKLLPPQALVARLEHRLLVLTSGTRDMPVRQQTLRNTIEWSYNLLVAPEQRLFRQLAVFVGGCTLEAAEAVAAGTDDVLPTLDGVSSLLDKSLLQAGQEEEEPRLFMLETIREYGLECLRECGEVKVIQRTHALYYLAFVEGGELHLHGEEQTLWLARLEREQENLRAALVWLIEQQETELVMRFCGALWWFWYLRGYWSEGRRWLKATLELTSAERPTAARAKVLCSAGKMAYYQNDYAIARPLLEESIALCRRLDIKSDLVNALSALGMLMYRQGDSEVAHSLLEESEALCRATGSTWELAQLLRKLGYVAWNQGNLIQATAYAQEGLALARKVGDKFHIATALSTLSSIAERQGDLTQARALAQEVLTLARELRDKSLIATTLQNLGYMTALQGDLTQAAALAEEGLSLFREMGDKFFMAVALHSLGHIASRQGNITQAATFYQEGLSLSQEIGNDTEMGWHLIGLAEVADAEGSYHKVAHLLGAAEVRFDVNVNMNAAERAEYERVVQHVRTRLGEKAFMQVRAEGHSMAVEQILATQELAAMPEQDNRALQPTSSTKQISTYPNGLTAREMEVMRLVVQGMSNPQIAERLIVSLHTVNAHLRSIYNKLGVSSRSALTRYVLEQKLL